MDVQPYLPQAGTPSKCNLALGPLRAGFLQIFIVQFRKQNERNHRTDQTQEHIALRVPDVTLCPQKGFGIRRIGKRGQPFNNFVNG